MKREQHRTILCGTRANRTRKNFWFRRAVLAATYLGIGYSFMAVSISGATSPVEPENPCSLVQSYDMYIEHCRAIRINEIEQDCLAHDSSHPDDWVELYNSGPCVVDISGWMVISIETAPNGAAIQWKRVTIDDDTVLQPDEFEVIRGSGNWLEDTVVRVCLVAKAELYDAFLVDVAHACGDGVDSPYGTFFYGDPDDSEREIELTWQRVPDGGTAAWRKLPATPKIANQAPEDISMAISQVRCHQDNTAVSECVTILNHSEDAQSVEGWTLRWGTDPVRAIDLPEYTILPSKFVNVYTGWMPSTGTIISLGNDEPLWSTEMPDVIELRNRNGWFVASSSYWTDYSLSVVLQTIPLEALE